MATEIYLVKVGMNMTEGVVEEWYVADGDPVKAGQLLYRLETEKVNLDVDAEVSGIVRHVVPEGFSKEPGEIVGYILEPGEAMPDTTTLSPAPAGPTESTPTATPASPQETSSPERIKASPAARRLARELNVDYTLLSGSGPGGRIVEADVAAASTPSPSATLQQPSSPIARKLARELNVDISHVKGTGPGGRVTKDDVERAANDNTELTSRAPTTLPVKGMRKTIAKRMHDSLQEMAQLTMDMDVEMTDAIKLRSQLIDEWAEENIRPTYTDLVVRAVARALVKHPLMNSSWGEQHITQHGNINVGMAVALDEGLVVPVVHAADQISMKTLVTESGRLAQAARDNTLGLDDLQDGTFTVSALGMFGVDSFTPIVNSPQAGILGVNRIRDDLRWEGERPVRTQVMRLSLTWDHRVLDGAPAAQFLGEVKSLLEAPFRLLL